MANKKAKWNDIILGTRISTKIVNIVKANKSGMIYFLQIQYFKTSEKILNRKKKRADEVVYIFTSSCIILKDLVRK